MGYEYDILEVCEGIDVFLEILVNLDYFYIWLNGIGVVVIEFFDDWGNLFIVGIYIFGVMVIEMVFGCINVEGFFIVIVNLVLEV